MKIALSELFDPLPAGVQRAGSLTALPSAAREPAARHLENRGFWTHIDVMEPDFAGRWGVPPGEVAGLCSLSHQVDVHLMVAEPSAYLPEVLAARPSRVTVHVERMADPAALAEQIRAAGADPWLAAAPETDPTVILAAAGHFGGVLLLLIPPGSTAAPDHCRLELARRLAATSRVGIDGGVTAAIIALAAGLSLTYVVAGRELMSVEEA